MSTKYSNFQSWAYFLMLTTECQSHFSALVSSCMVANAAIRKSVFLYLFLLLYSVLRKLSLKFAIQRKFNSVAIEFAESNFDNSRLTKEAAVSFLLFFALTPPCFLLFQFYLSYLNNALILFRGVSYPFIFLLLINALKCCRAIGHRFAIETKCILVHISGILPKSVASVLTMII